MSVVHWNVSEIGGPGFGTGKYEDNLYEQLENTLDFEVSQVKRRNGGITGSMPLSWIERYRQSKFDITHATFQTVAPASLLHSPQNFVVTVHDLAPILYPSEVRDLSIKLQWFLTPIALRKADHLIAISEFTKSEIIRLLDIPPSDISVVHQGIDHSMYMPRKKSECKSKFNLDPDNIHILVVSSGLEHKRLDVVKPILSHVQKTYPNARLLKAGYGQEIEGDDVINTGWVAEEDMPALYSAADIYLHPSEYEGFGLPVLEAMACGTPVVAREVASIPEVIGDCFDLVDSDATPEEFANLISSYLSLDSPVKDAVDRSEQFSWEMTARKTTDVYWSLLE